MKRALVTIFTLALAWTPVEARTKAAAWVVKEQIAEACDGGRGTIDPVGVIERDLDGDASRVGEEDVLEPGRRDGDERVAQRDGRPVRQSSEHDVRHA